MSNIEDYIVALCDILIKSLESFASALQGNFSRKKWNRSSAISPRGKWKINPTCPDLFLLDRAVEKQTNTYIPKRNSRRVIVERERGSFTFRRGCRKV